MIEATFTSLLNAVPEKDAGDETYVPSVEGVVMSRVLMAKASFGKYKNPTRITDTPIRLHRNETLFLIPTLTLYEKN